MPGLAGTVRAGEWWHYKLVPIFAAFIATLTMLGQAIAPAWQAAVMLLLAITAGAVFVSLLNDLTDIDEDRRAGKTNRMEGRSTAFRAGGLAIPVAAGLAFLFVWRDDPLLASLYLAAWIAFSLYSLSPFRLKARGLWGVLADACGAHLFPTMVAMVLAFRAAGRPVDPIWIAAGAAWAFGYGLRGILWHQLADRESDRAAGVRTFGERHSPRLLVAIGRWFAFPLEAAGLAILIGGSGALLPLAFLGAYLLLVWLRLRHWSMTAVLVEPKPNYLIWLHEYYDVFFPLSLLIASAVRHPSDLLVLAAYLLLFPQRPRQTIEDARKLLHQIYVGRRGRG